MRLLESLHAPITGRTLGCENILEYQSKSITSVFATEFERFNKSKKWNMILCNHLFKKAKICQRVECVLQLCIVIKLINY